MFCPNCKGLLREVSKKLEDDTVIYTYRCVFCGLKGVKTIDMRKGRMADRLIILGLITFGLNLFIAGFSSVYSAGYVYLILSTILLVIGLSLIIIAAKLVEGKWEFVKLKRSKLKIN